MPSKRKNKTKKEVVSDIQLRTDAERRRALIRDVIFPYLLDMNQDIQSSNVFLQAFSGLIEGIYEERRRLTTVGSMSDSIKDRINTVFAGNEIEKKRYINFVSKLNDISIQDLAYAAELPRFIHGFMIKNKGKELISNIPIDEILG